MNSYRNVKLEVKGICTSDGAGVKLVRLFNCRDSEQFDPFLMMDAFDTENPEDYVKGFPWHPHRGIETVTYLLEGQVEHGDSLGNKGVIRCGDCQWMTAGSGIIHQEMPKPPGRMKGVQLWLNLPREYKMTDPSYGDILGENIPVIQYQGCEIRLISGLFGGKSGAFEGRYVKPLFMDVTVPPETEFVMDTVRDDNLYTYAFDGSGYYGDKDILYGNHSVLLFEAGDKFRVKSATEGVRLIILSGRRLNEPVACGGPIVMNTREEIEKAWQELGSYTFIKHKR